MLYYCDTRQELGRGQQAYSGEGNGKGGNECDYIFVMRNEVPQIDGRINASLSDPIHKNGTKFLVRGLIIVTAFGLHVITKKIKRYLCFFDFHFLFQIVCKRGGGTCRP